MAEWFFRKKSKGEVERGLDYDVYYVFRSCGFESIGCEKDYLVTEI